MLPDSGSQRLFKYSDTMQALVTERRVDKWIADPSLWQRLRSQQRPYHLDGQCNQFVDIICDWLNEDLRFVY